MRLLIVKTSSLGDVIHTLSAVTDASRAVPGLACDWLVEEAYREVPSWHPAIRRVIPCALRRWRRAPLAAWRSGEWSAFRADLRRDAYDLVLDSQGLVKSALLAVQARGPVAGRTFGSAREPLAALFFRYRIPVDVAGQNEVGQARQLYARALGYEQPATPPDFGIDAGRFPRRDAAAYAVLVHGAGWATKLWPEDRWQALGRQIASAGVKVKLPWGSDQERARAERIAAACGGEVLPRLELGPVAELLAGARFVVGLDTGLTHLAVALGVRTVALYGPTTPVLDRVGRGELVNLRSVEEWTIDTSRPNTVALERVQEAVERWLV
jgi:heptosyltransferase-1